VSDDLRHEPLCTVLQEQVSESIWVSKREVACQTRRLGLPSRTWPTQTQTRFCQRPVFFHKTVIGNPIAFQINGIASGLA
jgi:hypothetical protein